MQAPELAEKIEGAIGEGSQFHEPYGYYAQGVGPETAILPSGWINRVHRVQNTATDDRVGYCLNIGVFQPAIALQHRPRWNPTLNATELFNAFSLHLVKTGRVAVDLGKALNKVEDLRLIADYKGDAIEIEDAQWALEQSLNFVQTMKVLFLFKG